MSFGDDVAGFEHVTLTANNVALHVVVGAAPGKRGPLVVLLHGWPESWVTWRHVMKPLRDAGFTVAALDLRGFGDSEKPRGVGAYTLDTVANDVVAVVHALGFEKAHVIGHDWGGAVAWQLGQYHGDVVDKLVVINAPHPAIFAKRLRTMEQLKASYYMFVFQVPVVAERLVSAQDFRPLKNILKYQPRRKGAFDDEDVRLYVEQMKKPNALTSGLNYYRAAARAIASGKAQRPQTITRPTLVLWGLDDTALPPGNLDGLERWVSDLRVVRVPNCSHWVQHDAPETIVAEATAFFGATSTSSAAAA